jgi:hypothetical protein
MSMIQKRESLAQYLLGPIGYFNSKHNRVNTADILLKVTFMFLQVIDLVLTVIAARYGFPELNPFMRMSLTSVEKLAIFKFGIPMLIAWFVPGLLLIPAILLLGVVVGWNMKELISLAIAYY